MKKIFLILLAAVAALGIAGVGNGALKANAEESGKNLDIYLIAGQSNAVGYTKVSDSAALAEEDSRMVTGYENVYYYGYSDREVTTETIPQISIQPVKTGLGQRSSSSVYFGPELGMANYFANNGSEEEYGIIKYASGSSSIYDDHTSTHNARKGNWCSPSVEEMLIERYNIEPHEKLTGLCYSTFLEIVESGLQSYRQAGFNPVIKGLCWMQGESEGGTSTWSKEYANLLEKLIYDMRKDLSLISGSDLSEMNVVIAKLPTNYPGSYVLTVREQQQLVADNDADIYTIDNEGFTLPGTDEYHYNQADMLQLGKNFAEKMLEIVESGNLKVTYNSGAGGECVTKSQVAVAGEEIGTRIVCNTGYEVDNYTFVNAYTQQEVVLDDVYFTGTYLGFIMPGFKLTVNVNFKPVPQFKITSSAHNGTIFRTTANRDPYRDERVTFIFTPDDGYRFDYVLIDGKRVNASLQSTYATYETKITDDISVEAFFVPAAGKTDVPTEITKGNVALAVADTENYLVKEVCADGVTVTEAGSVNGEYLYFLTAEPKTEVVIEYVSADGLQSKTVSFTVTADGVISQTKLNGAEAAVKKTSSSYRSTYVFNDGDIDVTVYAAPQAPETVAVPNIGLIVGCSVGGALVVAAAAAATVVIVLKKKKK